MSRSRYWQHGEMHFAYNVDASYVCPVGKALAFSPDDPPTSRVEQAAAALKMDPHRLAVMLRKSSCGARDRDGEKLTERCCAHGVKMSRRGYRAFVDEPVPADEQTGPERTNARISQRLGMGEGPRRTVDEKWCATKREARQWAYDKFVEARDAAKVAAA